MPAGERSGSRRDCTDAATRAARGRRHAASGPLTAGARRTGRGTDDRGEHDAQDCPTEPAFVVLSTAYIKFRWPSDRSPQATKGSAIAELIAQKGGFSLDGARITGFTRLPLQLGDGLLPSTGAVTFLPAARDPGLQAANRLAEALLVALADPRSCTFPSGAWGAMDWYDARHRRNDLMQLVALAEECDQWSQPRMSLTGIMAAVAHRRTPHASASELLEVGIEAVSSLAERRLLRLSSNVERLWSSFSGDNPRNLLDLAGSIR